MKVGAGGAYGRECRHRQVFVYLYGYECHTYTKRVQSNSFRVFSGRLTQGIDGHGRRSVV